MTDPKVHPNREQSMSRREFVAAGAALGAVSLGTVALGASSSAAGAPFPPAFALEDPAAGAHVLPALPYPAAALEPVIDARTMEIHHGKHHAAYVKNLNAALSNHAGLLGQPLETLLADNAAQVPEAIRQAVINNGGGHLNHTLFWSHLGPAGKIAAAPEGELLAAITATFGSVQSLQDKVNDAGMKRFGSGWAWLVKNKEGKLEVLSTANQDSPVMSGKIPLLGIDVWEHAYYLKYQNLRADYLKEIWKVIDWRAVGARYGK